MIKLMFERQGQYFFITINNDRTIYYWDKLQGRLWDGPLQYLPPSPASIKKIRLSRNKIPLMYIELLRVTPEELREYEEAKTLEELKKIIIHDATKHGCKLLREQHELE